MAGVTSGVLTLTSLHDHLFEVVMRQKGDSYHDKYTPLGKLFKLKSISYFVEGLHISLSQLSVPIKKCGDGELGTVSKVR